MKTKIIVIIGLLSLVNLSFTNHKVSQSIINNEETVIGTYDGFYSNMYNFLITDEDDLEEIVSFDEIEESLLKTYNLNDESLVGMQFEITYTTETVIEDDDGDELEYEVYTIKNLKQIK